MPPNEDTQVSAGVAESVATIVVRHRDEAFESGTRRLLSEAPINVVYGTIPYAVMMTTPCDLEDFAYGFSLTEGVIERAGDIRGVTLEHVEDGTRLQIDLAPNRMHDHLARRRAMAGRTSCGLCGIEDLAQVPRATRRVAADVTFEPRAIRRALDSLRDGQRLNHETGAAHAAAWCDRDGRVRALREDVGRHNALDKVIGAALRAGDDGAEGFLVVTSRCSYEMVEKAVAFGSGLLVAISAPTDLAVQRAAHHDLTLVALARADSCTIFTGAARILEPEATP
jgi:FdhD protein